MSNNSTSLLSLYTNKENSECTGCSILEARKPFFCKKDYTEVEPVDILFVTDSYRYVGWEDKIISDQEQKFFEARILPFMTNIKYAFTPAVKCPGVKETEMRASNMNICRKFLYESVAAYQPKLIIPLGNLAFKMLTKKSGIKDKHGSQFEYEGIPVVPTYNFNIIFIEPKYTEFIVQDITMAINKFIAKTVVPIDLDYQILNSIESVENFIIETDLDSTKEPVAIDIETTGLNFLTCKVLTVGLSFNHNDKVRTAVIPVFHKESLNHDTPQLIKLLNKITQNPHNIKVLHNAKFDMKFLKLLGVDLVHVYDTKGMAHLVDESQVGSLKNLVKCYLPTIAEFL